MSKSISEASLKKKKEKEKRKKKRNRGCQVGRTEQKTDILKAPPLPLAFLPKMLQRHDPLVGNLSPGPTTETTVVVLPVKTLDDHLAQLSPRVISLDVVSTSAITRHFSPRMVSK